MGDLLIDVSEFQGKPDWKKAKNKLKGVYIRVGLRGSLAKTAPQDYKKIRFDKSWKHNLSGVQAFCIPFGVYYFPTAINDEEALEGAKWFYDQVKDLDMDYPPMLDSENVWGTNKEPGRANSLSKAERTRLLKIVTDYFNARGMNIGIYASASWFTSHLDMSKFPQCVIDCTWVADSTGAVDYKGYYWLHQYGQGKCDGFSGNVDLNKVCGKIPAVKTTSKPKEVKADPVDVLLQIAQSEVGYHEGPNNSNKYGDEMHSIQPRNMDKNAPYCDAFCDWCVLQMCRRFGYDADMARKVLCGDFDDYTYFSVNLYKKAGRWTTKPGRGHQIFFGGDGHTGWVKSVDSKIHTIEGNKGDQVRECSYSLNDSKIIGYGMPRYDLIKGTVTVEEPTTANKNDGILRRGSTGKAVRFIQLCLGGLDDDGSFGWKTLSAVVEFQKSHGLEADGEVGPLTFAAILKTMPLIRKGDKGRYVKALQVALGGLEVDGSFGPLTDAAVREFQKEHSLVVDGEVGKKTWTAIFKYCFC